jgi:glutaredoxin-like YruB-family protein
MGVEVYTTPTCGFCHQLKGYLEQRGVAFTEHDVSRDAQAATRMVQLSGQRGVPVSVIDGEVVVGFNRPAIEQLLLRQAAQPLKLGVAIADAGEFGAKRGLQLPNGAYVGRVHAGSAAAGAGLTRGDVIVQLAGQAVRTDRDVDRIMASVRAGQGVDLTLWRDGQRVSATARF